MTKEETRRERIRTSLIGNVRRLGYKESDETKLKKSLALKGREPWNKGRRLADQTRKKMSISRKGKVHSWMHRTPSDATKKKLSETSKKAWTSPETRKKYHAALRNTKWLKVRMDVGQSELLEKWNRLGFRFEPNYQLHTGEDLFYIDGYDANLNVVMEYDGKYHRKPHQKQKDLERQNRIIATLNPKKFWRYDSVNKVFQNVTGQCDGQ